MANTTAGASAGTALSALGLFLSVTELQAMFSLIATILGIVLIIINLAFTIRDKVIKAKKDGKITEDEINDMAHDVKDAIENIHDEVKKNSK